MSESAQEIFNYLPIRRGILENEYINHLWRAFETLGTGDILAEPFAVMPFHLLFMLAVQYKVLRISREKKGEYELAFTMHIGRKHEIVSRPESVFALADLNERSVLDLLKLIGLDRSAIQKIKILIDNRNENLAHAKGGIESNPEARIEEYLSALQQLQICMQPLNDIVSDAWSNGFSTEDDISEVVDLKLLDSMLCLEDFKTGKLANNFVQYIQI